MNWRSRVWLFLFFVTTPTHAELARGPSLGWQWVGPARVEEQRAGKPIELTRSTQRREINLMAPLPKALPGGAWILKFDSFAEIRDLDGADAARGSNLFSRDDVTDLGLIWLAPKPVPFIQPILLFSYYSDWTPNDHPMREYALGADIEWLGGISRVLVRDREFPGFSEKLFFAGHRRQWDSGIGYDVFIPSHALLSYETAGHEWRFYGGLQWQGREYPAHFGGRHTWWSGSVEKVLLGIRYQLQAPIYVSFEAGSLRENIRLKDGDGEELAVWHGRAAGYARIGLEGWIDKP